jgi:Domain of unknown function (DUF6894)
MKRFFFDVLSAQSCSYDYCGRNFSRSEDAAEAAELIAMDLSCSVMNDWKSSRVQVRTATGETLYEFPITEAA